MINAESNIKKSASNRVAVLLVLILAIAFGLASILPLIWSLTRPMSGFIYSPFYTTNNFCDATLNGCHILHPEDRVIEVDHARISQLNYLTGQGGTLYLVYELVHALIGITVETQQWTVGRLLEKSGPLFITGFVLIWLMLKGLRQQPETLRNIETKPIVQKLTGLNWLLVSACLMGLALLATPDFYLAPGAGLDSGFDPLAHWQASEFLALTAKWSTYIYYPLWTLAAATLGTYRLQHLLAGRRGQTWAIAVGWLLITIDLIDYCYSACLTHHYNNPDYYVWHTRSEFWPLWLSILLLVWLPRSTASPKFLKLDIPNLLSRIAFTVFLLGFITPTVFDWMPPGLGVQWWAIAIIFYYRLQPAIKNIRS